MKDSDPTFFTTVSPHIPSDLSQRLHDLCATSTDTEAVLDALIRFVTGADCPVSSAVDNTTRDAWLEQQRRAKKAIQELKGVSSKHGRDDDDSQPPLQASKRQKTEGTAVAASNEDDPPRITLHSVSCTSPIRKKVDITIHESSVRFVNPTNNTLEAFIPLSYLRRSFIVPTRGKQKPHWTIYILSSDVPDRGKAAKGAAPTTNSQIIFGLDAVATAPLKTTHHENGETSTVIVAKGTETIDAIRTFVSNLPPACSEPSVEHFKSACAPPGSNPGGVPGLEACLGAKVSTLWFFDGGILWGDGKPEYWAVEDLLSRSKGEPVRVITATGRLCSLTLTRRAEPRPPVDSAGGEADEEEEEDIGEEVQFVTVDAREQDGIARWVRQRHGRFGRDPKSAVKEPDSGPSEKKRKDDSAAGPQTILQMAAEESDEEDQDFNGESDSDESGADSGDEDGEGSEGAESEEEEAHDSEADGEADDDELDEKNHPLLKPGAMPRMSRAAMDMVVGMVENDMMNAGDDEEMDELED